MRKSYSQWIGLCDDPYAITLCQGRRQTWRRDGREETEGLEMRRRCGGVRGGGRGGGRWRVMGERNSRVARTPKLVCHSVRQSAYSQAQTQVQCLRKWEYIYTHMHASAHKTHIFSLINASWMLEISFFIPRRSLIIPPPQQSSSLHSFLSFLTSLTPFATQ